MLKNAMEMNTSILELYSKNLAIVNKLISCIMRMSQFVSQLPPLLLTPTIFPNPAKFSS